MKNLSKDKIIIIFILLQPILDLLTSLMVRNIKFPVTIGLAIRSIFMLYMVYYIFTTKTEGSKVIKYSKIVLILLISYLFIFGMFSLLKKNVSFIISDVKGVIRTFYFPIVLNGIYIWNKKSKIELSNKLLTYVLMIYTSIIFIATITGTYFNSYSSYGFGSIGWFYSANEIGSVLVILAPFTIINLIQNKFNIVNILSILLCLFSTLYMGTKVPFLGILSISIFLSIYFIGTYVLSRFKLDYEYKYNNKKVISSLTFILLSSLLMFGKSPLYKNIELNYGHIIEKIKIEFQNKNNVMDENELSEVPKEEIEQKDEEKVQKNEIIDAILSNRTVYADQVRKSYKNSNIFGKLIGIGYVIELEDGTFSEKTVELDQLDIYYRHGIVGTILYFIQFLLILAGIFKNIFNQKYKILDLDILTCLFSIGIGFGIAFTAGHVLTSPTVAFFIILINIKLYSISKKNTITDN